MDLSSVDIAVFDFNVLYDLASVNPSVKITNQSAGPNLAGCSYIFMAYSSSGIPYYLGSWDTPDKVGAWTSFVIPTPILQVLNHIEWSGSDFKVVGYVKDSHNNTYGPLEKTTTICKPNGNKNGQKDNYGQASADVKVYCQEARVYIEDVTDYSYKGMHGIVISKDLKLIYPLDKTGSTPDPFTQANFNIIQAPIWFSSKNYQVWMETVIQYNFANNTTVQFKYKFREFFDVLCNIDLCPLLCEIERMENDINAGGCSAEDLKKLVTITSMMNRALIAKFQPLCGVDLARLVDKIKEVGGFTCDCCYGDGVSQLTSEQQEGFSPNGNCSPATGVTSSIT
jgi:hypothetical protein